MILTTDFHTHILPGIDDGCQSVQDSVKLIQCELKDGIENIFLTPHFYPQQMFPSSFLENRNQAMEQLLASFPSDAQLPNLILGAEVLYCPGMSQWEQLDSLTLGNSNYILIEMPFDRWSDNTFLELKRICKRGLTPILAHIERSIPVLGAARFINCLHALPVLLQSNCEFFTDKRTQRTALKLLAEKKIHIIGSDCHRPNWRSPNMSQAKEIILNNIDHETRLHLKQSENLILSSMR